VNAGDGMRAAGEKGLAADRDGRKEVTLDGFAGHPASVRRANGCVFRRDLGADSGGTWAVIPE